jgi:hypothetical protein
VLSILTTHFFVMSFTDWEIGGYPKRNTKCERWWDGGHAGCFVWAVNKARFVHGLIWDVLPWPSRGKWDAGKQLYLCLFSDLSSV